MRFLLVGTCELDITRQREQFAILSYKPETADRVEAFPVGQFPLLSKPSKNIRVSLNCLYKYPKFIDKFLSRN